jgi:hypothetical protein
MRKMHPVRNKGERKRGQETGSELFFISFRLFVMAMRLGATRAWPILSLEIHHPICYALRSVPLVFFGNPINQNQTGEALPKRGKIAILTPKKIGSDLRSLCDLRGKIAICSPTR